MRPSLLAPKAVMIDCFTIKPAVSFEGQTCMHFKVLIYFIKAADWCTCDAGAGWEVGATGEVFTAASQY